VLSFPQYATAAEIASSKDIVCQLGDIVISADKILEQAAEYGQSPERELGFLTVHGMLHLLGYDHMNEDDERVMTQKQEEILGMLGLVR
jgi:probable rRNA maturation factor